MTALELLSNLRDRGVRLWVEGADLRFSAPKGALGSSATELLTRHKAELIELLRPTPVGQSPLRESNSKSQSFSLDEHVIQLSEVHDWRLEDQDPYVRYVAPYKGFLYQRMALDKKFVRGEGCYLYDEAGNRYADFIAQFGAVPFGHDPATIWEALSLVRQQCQPNLVITSISAAAGELAERLLAIAPEGLNHAVFTNSGAEAIEAAIKLARCRTGRVGILSTRDGFHGLTLGGMSATGRDFFQRGFGAPVLGFNYVPFGDVEALQATLQTRPDFFAAFIVEIIQGEFWDPRRSGRLSEGRRGSVPPLRRLADRRRGADRAWSNRGAIRLRAGRRDARHSRARESAGRRTHADRRLPLFARRLY